MINRKGRMMMKAVVTYGGEVHLHEMASPLLLPKSVRVKTLYSAISPGTELNLISIPTITNPFPLGYSAVGIVEEVGEEVSEIKPGDRVACYGGPYVFHGETLSVPETLCAKLPEGVSLKEAAFVGMGSVAIHGMRKAELQFGESVLVLGLGILGQIAYQVGVQASYQVIGADLLSERVRLAREGTKEPNGNVVDLQQEGEGALSDLLHQVTGGAGVDAVVITAHSMNRSLIDDALKWVRFRGKIVIVGNMKIAFEREAFFQKEADLLIARAAGPGRYDPHYEREAIDYPLGYIRWTEGRNMRELIRLLHEGRIKLSHLITHEFPFHEAPSAYPIMKKEHSLGVLLRYGAEA